MHLSYPRKGFTLVELMVVIAIIGILAAALYPSIGNYFLRAKIANQFQQLKSIRTALEAYNIDNGIYPESTNWWNEYDCYNWNHPWYNQKDQWIPWLVNGWYITNLPNGNLGLYGECNNWLFLYISDSHTIWYKLISHGFWVGQVVRLSHPELIDPHRDGGVNPTGVPEIDSNYSPWAWGFWTDIPFYQWI